MRAKLLVSQTSTHGLRVVACACLITALVGAGSTLDSAPELLVHFPHDGTRAALPLHVRYSASAPCRSALAVDGLIVSFFEHVDTGLIADVRLPSVSLDRHSLALDVVDARGNLLRRGPRWSIDMDQGSQESEADDSADWQDEPVDPYDPKMSQEDMAQAEFVDGWWLVKQDNFEFTRPEPSDTCEDVPGWRRRTSAQGPRRIWDAFQLFNELDMLEVRLNELNATVHKFVLVEASRTHSNKPKPLHFGENKQRFAAFLHKIVHVVVDDLPNNTDAWVLENFQRNAILRGLAGANPSDLVVIADVDEIPVPYVLDLLRYCEGPTWPVWLYARFFNFKFSWEFVGQWKHPQVLRAGQLALEHLAAWHARQAGRGGGHWTGAFRPVMPQEVRMGSMRSWHTKIESGAWHCSFFTDADGVIEKVAAFTHQELNVPAWLQRDAIAAAIEQGTDYFNADMQGNRKPEPSQRHGGLTPNPSCHGLPRYVLEHAERFAAWLPDCSLAHGEDTPLPHLAFAHTAHCLA